MLRESLIWLWCIGYWLVLGNVEQIHTKPTYIVVLSSTAIKKMEKMPINMTHPLLQKLEKETDDILRTIRDLVELESPTTDKQACSRLAAYLQGRLEDPGMIVKRTSVPDFPTVH